MQPPARHARRRAVQGRRRRLSCVTRARQLRQSRAQGFRYGSRHDRSPGWGRKIGMQRQCLQRVRQRLPRRVGPGGIGDGGVTRHFGFDPAAQLGRLGDAFAHALANALQVPGIGAATGPHQIETEGVRDRQHRRQIRRVGAQRRRRGQYPRPHLGLALAAGQAQLAPQRGPVLRIRPVEFAEERIVAGVGLALHQQAGGQHFPFHLEQGVAFAVQPAVLGIEHGRGRVDAHRAREGREQAEHRDQDRSRGAEQMHARGLAQARHRAVHQGDGAQVFLRQAPLQRSDTRGSVQAVDPAATAHGHAKTHRHRIAEALVGGDRCNGLGAGPVPGMQHEIGDAASVSGTIERAEAIARAAPALAHQRMFVRNIAGHAGTQQGDHAEVFRTDHPAPADARLVRQQALRAETRLDAIGLGEDARRQRFALLHRGRCAGFVRFHLARQGRDRFAGQRPVAVVRHQDGAAVAHVARERQHLRRGVVRRQQPAFPLQAERPDRIAGRRLQVVEENIALALRDRIAGRHASVPWSAPTASRLRCRDENNAGVPAFRPMHVRCATAMLPASRRDVSAAYIRSIAAGRRKVCATSSATRATTSLRPFASARSCVL